MPSPAKSTDLAHTLFKLSFEADRISPERVDAVLAWVDTHKPPRATAVLRAYRRLVAEELAKRRAVIEFAGDVAPAAFEAIADAMSKRYGYTVEPVPVPRPELLAGVRVRVGCDIYENTVLSQLSALKSV